MTTYSRMICLIIFFTLGLPQLATAQDNCYRVGTWNIEVFKNGVSRGFPERAGQIPARGPEEINKIAIAIRDIMNFKLLTIQEVNGSGVSSPTSSELDALLTALGPTFQSSISKSGGSKRVAFVWDTSFVRKNQIHEIEVPPTEVIDGGEASDIFARDPLVGHFTLLENGSDRTDFVFVGLHLASGQHRVNNHDQAMQTLRTELAQLEGTDPVFPVGEEDILIGGDLNASWFDNNQENFFDDFNQGEWKVLVRKNHPYPPTRVNGSQIDYLIATTNSSSSSGLVKDEIDDDEALVYLGIAGDGRFRYRDVYSDHFPVGTCINVVANAD